MFAKSHRNKIHFQNKCLLYLFMFLKNTTIKNTTNLMTNSKYAQGY